MFIAEYEKSQIKIKLYFKNAHCMKKYLNYKNVFVMDTLGTKTIHSLE